MSERRKYVTRIELRMDAYYFGFSSTGVREIDEILSAVACAGKAYHHTDHWNDSDDGEPSYAELIQEAADRAATVLRAHRSPCAVSNDVNPPVQTGEVGSARKRDVLSEYICAKTDLGKRECDFLADALFLDPESPLSASPTPPVTAVDLSDDVHADGTSAVAVEKVTHTD